MNVYIVIFLFTLAVIVGYLSGFAFMLYIYRDKEVISTEKAGDNMMENELETEDDTVHNSLASRFTDRGNSYTDLICETEEFNEEQYVEEKRQKQTMAYNYAGTKNRR